MRDFLARTLGTIDEHVRALSAAESDGNLVFVRSEGHASVALLILRLWQHWRRCYETFGSATRKHHKAPWLLGRCLPARWADANVKSVVKEKRSQGELK